MQFEIRMTAYNRPNMLRRALQSIQAQAYPHWKAIVYDDSSDTASRDVVEGIGDTRILYRRNPERLGAVANVDQCMSPVPVFGGHYGCLLEDDNYWFSTYLSSVVARLQKKAWSLVQTNQGFADVHGRRVPAEETTRGGWFHEGKVDPLVLRSTLFLMEGVSNSGLVWRLNGNIDLRLEDLVHEAGLNEACRSLLIGAPFLFIAQPLGVYTIIERSNSARAADRDRSVNRGIQRIRDYLLRVHGESIVRLAEELAIKNGLTNRLIDNLAYSGHLLQAAALARGRGARSSPIRAWAKGLASRLVEDDPCAIFLTSARIPVIESAAGSRH